MKALILNPLSRALCMIALICICAAGIPKTQSGDDVLTVSKGSLEATLKIQTCNDKSILTIEWKNTSSQAVTGVLSLKTKAGQSSIIDVSTSVAANEVKTETCDSIDAEYRKISFSDFADVEAELTVIN